MIGITINIISLFGMILVVGILVDDGIVVAENIFSHFEKGKSPLRASLDGTMEVLPAVFTGVSTTIVAFTAFFLPGWTLWSLHSRYGLCGHFLFGSITYRMCLLYSRLTLPIRER